MANKKVHIRIDKTGNLYAYHNFVTIKTKKKEQVIWRGHGGRIKIAFDKPEGSPFGWPSVLFPDETDKPSGQAIVQPVPKKRFRYSVTMTRPNGDVLTLDPGVDVDGGGPPGGSSKKAHKKVAKKAARKKSKKKSARKRSSRKKK